MKDLVLEESVISVGGRPLGFATNMLKVCGVGTTTVTITSKIAGADGKKLTGRLIVKVVDNTPAEVSGNSFLYGDEGTTYSLVFAIQCENQFAKTEGTNFTIKVIMK